MKKRWLSMAMVLVLSATTVLAAGCGGGKNEGAPIKDGKTLNIKVNSAGYGTSFVNALADKFNAIYANSAEGYKVNVLPPQQNLGNTNLLQDIYSDSGVDVYWASTPIKLALEGEYGVCLVDMTESVMAKPAIKFDGTQESKTIAEKIDESNFYLGDNIIYDGKYYGMPSVVSTAGFACNTRLLTEYKLEIPKTTNELWHCVDVIMEKAPSTRVFPFTYSTSGNNYPINTLQYWYAQYAGVNAWEQFWSMQNADGSNMEKPYEVFNDEAVEKALVEFYRAFDYNIAADGSAMQDYTAAQGQIMMGDAVFMSTGSWMYNEENVRYSEYMDDVTFIKAPVISSLGYKLFSNDGYNAEKCEAILSAICDGVDANKDVATIESEVESTLSVSLDTADVEKVVEARGISLVRGTTSWCISSKIPNEIKPIAELFLRMCASEDGAKLMSQHTNEVHYFAPDVFANRSEPWFKGADAMLHNVHTKQVKPGATGYRSKMGVGDAMFPYMTTYASNTILAEKITRYNNTTLAVEKGVSIYETAAQACAKSVYDHAKKQCDNKLWNVD